MFLFIDTETTGLPENGSNRGSFPSHGRLRASAKRHASRHMIVRPDGFTIPSSAISIHGIHNSARTAGRPTADARPRRFCLRHSGAKADPCGGPQYRLRLASCQC